ncbi:hypothetical protein cypCar_00040977 [Cyprinus carpio]|nr:hypothetical protein cypCar_00040977 [Cyprinus carpio]
MNNTLQDRNMFTVQADVIFHAANLDSPESPIPGEGNNNNVPALGKTGIPSMEILQGLPGTWDTSESGGLTDNRSLGNNGAVTENCYEILTIAKKQRFNELKETAYRFMSDNFLQILRDPAVYGRLTGSERDLILRKRMESRQCLMVAEINDVFERVGSRPPSRNSSRPQSPLSITSFEDNHMIYYYNKSSKDWHTLTVMPEDINTRGCGICTMYNYLFVAGGIRGTGEKSKVSDKVFCYNPITDRWSEVRPMKQARSQLKLVSMDGNLYAIGGECLFTVEKYDPRMDRWTAVAPLPKGAFAVAHEATTCNGELYVSGGSLFYRLLKFDPKRDEWQECPYNNSRKKSTDMVALKSFIYRFDVNREQGISVFKYNTIVKMWHDCASQQQGCTLPEVQEAST